jgi:uncharacterized protein
MSYELILIFIVIGIFTGLISSFFGIGGGLFLVPILLYFDFDIKDAIFISIFQMIFSSIYGSVLNFRNNSISTVMIKKIYSIFIGAFAGAIFSAFIILNTHNLILKYIFILILIFSIFRIYLANRSIQIINISHKIVMNKIILFIVGFSIAMLSITIGIGGSILVIPFLISFIQYDLKKATSVGLFFVIFTSIPTFSLLFSSNYILLKYGFIIGISSLFGVFLGIKYKNIVDLKLYRKYILYFYIAIFILMIYKI